MRARKTNLRLLTEAQVRDGGPLRAVVLEFSPACGDTLTVRLAGTRTRYPVAVEAIYWGAVRRAAELKRKDKAKARRAGKKA